MLKRSNYNNIEKLTKKKFQVKDKMVFENLIKAKAKKSGQKKKDVLLINLFRFKFQRFMLFLIVEII